VASTACTREPLSERDPIKEEVHWVDLASAGQLDLPPSIVGPRGDKELRFGKKLSLKIKNKVFCIFTIGMPSIGHVPSDILGWEVLFHKKSFKLFKLFLNLKSDFVFK
jgi:hypothetical protein